MPAHLARRREEPAGVPLGLPTAHRPRPARVVLRVQRAGARMLARTQVRRRAALVEPLPEMMAARWVHAGIGGDVLVPVPVHAARCASAASIRLSCSRAASARLDCLLPRPSRAREHGPACAGPPRSRRQRRWRVRRERGAPCDFRALGGADRRRGDHRCDVQGLCRGALRRARRPSRRSRWHASASVPPGPWPLAPRLHPVDALLARHEALVDEVAPQRRRVGMTTARSWLTSFSG